MEDIIVSREIVNYIRDKELSKTRKDISTIKLLNVSSKDLYILDEAENKIYLVHPRTLHSIKKPTGRIIITQKGLSATINACDIKKDYIAILTQYEYEKDGSIADDISDRWIKSILYKSDHVHISDSGSFVIYNYYVINNYMNYGILIIVLFITVAVIIMILIG